MGRRSMQIYTFTKVAATKCTMWVINEMYVTLNKLSGVSYLVHKKEEKVMLICDIIAYNTMYHLILID